VKAKLHWMSFMMLLIPLLMLLAACGAGDQPPAEAPPAAAPEQPVVEPAAEEGVEPAAGEETAGALPANCSSVELQYWNPFTGPDGPYMGQMVDAFNAEHPDINVVMTTQSEYGTQLTTAAASNTLPHVAIMWADQVATWAYRGVLRPMDNVVQQEGLSGNDFPESVWAAGEVNGTRYAIPLDIHPLVMFYNNDLLQEGGAAGPPTNREEFEQAATAMTQGGNNGFMLTSGFPIGQIFRTLLHQYGGSEFNEDGTEVTWNSPEGVQALEWMREAQAQWSQPNLEVDAELNAFRGGTVGMIWNGIWQTTNVTGEGVIFDGQATAVPQIGDQMAVWGGSHQLIMPVQQTEDECQDAAAGMFISYLLDNSVTWASAGQIPASNTVRNGSEFQAIQPQASIAPSAEHVIMPPSVPGITDAFVPMEEAVSAVMAGTATDIQAALDEAATRGNQILEENRSNYGDAPPTQ
jgi:multiple sugar transport system substrate-binding protein